LIKKLNLVYKEKTLFCKEKNRALKAVI
jgi:hypothetical protein